MSNTIGRSLNLYTIKPADRIEQATYDVFLGAVVAAETFEEARSIHPNSYCFWDEGAGSWYSWKRVQVGTGVFATEQEMHTDEYYSREWVSDPKENVVVKFIGLAEVGVTRGVVMASFNAG